MIPSTNRAPQRRFWFSPENLAKDKLKIRKNMDAEGYIPLAFIAGLKRTHVSESAGNDFKYRMEILDMDILRSVCKDSSLLEYVDDGSLEKVRCKDDWEKWILPQEKQEKEEKKEEKEEKEKKEKEEKEEKEKVMEEEEKEEEKEEKGKENEKEEKAELGQKIEVQQEAEQEIKSKRKRRREKRNRKQKA